MKNRNYIFLLVSAILGFVAGIGYCITIFGAIAGIPIITGAFKYLAWSKMTDEELAKTKDSLMLWGIIYTILMFPLGGIALVAPFNLEGQIYSGNDKKEYKPTEAKPAEQKSKAERISELNELKEKGLIDEKDFEIAKGKIINE